MRLLVCAFLMAVAMTMTGCEADISHSSDWKAPVLATAENPHNGMHNFTPTRAEVIADRCGLLRRSCTSVRLLDETGYANANGGRVFTYARVAPIAIKWADDKTLTIKCETCKQASVMKQLPSNHFFQLKYEM